MENQIALPENYEDICNNISDMILTAQKKAFYAVNTSHIMLNWNIGRELRLNVLKNEKAEYGKAVISTNLFRMIQLYDNFEDREKVATLSRQLTWSHFLEIITISDELKRKFYATLCMKEQWSVRGLRGHPFGHFTFH